jgi:anthranilate phosphoribosyltransferase
MVCLNAGAAFYCAGMDTSIEEGYKRSCDLIESGKVKKVYEQYIALSAL